MATSSNKKLFMNYISKMESLNKDQLADGIYNALLNGKNSYLRMSHVESSHFDPSWIKVIEDCLYDLGEIVNNPRGITKQESSVTPVELAKKIDGESVQHLAAHTQFIKEVDEKGNVMPSKILSHYNEDNIHTYENRFIATFIRRLVLFIEKRYQFIHENVSLFSDDVLIMKNTTEVNGQLVEIETKVRVRKPNEDQIAIEARGYIERIKSMRQYITYYYNSPFMKQMKNEKDVRKPILQTNIIRKNPRYRKCFETFTFIEGFDNLGVTYHVNENYSTFSDYEKEQYNYLLFGQYLALQDTKEFESIRRNDKVYKPRILASLDDEKFIYGPIYRGPIEFVRVDEAYRKYKMSLIREDLPKHPNKKEKEFYKDDYEVNHAIREENRQIDRLLARTYKDVAQFDKEVEKIVEARRLEELEIEKAKLAEIRKDEERRIEEKRKEIIAAAKAREKERLAQEAEERRIAEENERLREEQERRLAEELARQEEEARLAKEEAERLEQERLAKEEAERKAAEEAEAERLRQEEEQRRLEEEAKEEEVISEPEPQIEEEQPQEELVEETPVEEEKPQEEPIEEAPIEEEVIQETEEPSKEEVAEEIEPIEEAKEEQPMVEESEPEPQEPVEDQPQEESVEEAPVVEETPAEEEPKPEDKPKKKRSPRKKKAEPVIIPVEEEKTEEAQEAPVEEKVEEPQEEVPTEETAPAEEEKPVEKPKRKSSPRKKKVAPVKKEPVEEKKEEPKQEAPIEEEKPVEKPKRKSSPRKKKPAPVKEEEKPEPQKEVKEETPIEEEKPKKKPSNKKKKAEPKAKETPKAKPEKKKPSKPRKPKEKEPLEVIPGKFIVKTYNGYYITDKKFSVYKKDAKLFDNFVVAKQIKARFGGKIIKL